MKNISSILTAGIVLFFASCGNSGKETAETPAADTTAMETAAAAPDAPAFTSFKVLAIQHKVKNFEKWRVAYMAHDSMRQTYGITHFRLGRGLEDSNMVFLADIITDVEKAKEFAASPDLKDAMKKAGVISAPSVNYDDVIRMDSSVIDQNLRVRISHRVKDFDAWLKVYEDEGKESRAVNGLIDRSLSRGIDDPNMVTIVFAISDMEKAKARMNSTELKALMLGAGVEGPPTILFYRLVD
ncbi:MAG: hypothetical protein ABIT08_12995 [Bacteroidia bacterium]